MKKLIMTVAVLACAASIVSAQVYSENVVGYAKRATPVAGGFDIASLNIFGDLDIQDVIVNLEDLNASSVKANADKIYVWTGTGYATYGLYDKSGVKFWMDTQSAGWSKATKASASTALLNRGSAVWYETGAGGTASELMTAGDVPDDGTPYDIAVTDFSLVAYPYATTINLQDLVVANATASSVKADADKIYVWSGTGYATYGLYDKSGTEFWMDTQSAGWSKATKASASDADLNLGAGVWYESVDGAKTIGFTQNY